MAVSPTNSNDVFIREVDDAVREDRLKGFWDRYGKLVLGLILVGLLIYGGYLFYSHLQTQRAGEGGEAFVQAFEKGETGDSAGAQKDLGAIAKEGTPAYRAGAQMMQAALALGKNDTAKAVSLYGQVATDPELPQVFRDLATIRMLTVQFDTEKPDAIIARVKPIAVEENPAFASAGELLGLAYVKAGKDAEAADIFRKVAESKTTPDTLKQRAQQMAAMLAGGAARVQVAPAAPVKNGGDQKK